MSAQCDHGYPSPAACADCMFEGVMPTPKPKVPRDAEIGPRIVAKFDGHCWACGGRVDAGTTRLGLLIDADEWICERCWP